MVIAKFEAVMRKIFAVLLIVLAVPSFGQEPMSGMDVRAADEISLSYGMVTVPDLANVLVAVFGTIFTMGLAKPDKLDCLGAVNIGYYHWLSGMFAVGGEGSFERIRLTFKQGDRENPNTNFDTYVSLMPSVKGMWLNRQHWGVYSKLSLGGMMHYRPAADYLDGEGNTVHNPSKTEFYFACQCSPVGFEFGGNHWWGFIESGFGVQGGILGGVRCKF